MKHSFHQNLESCFIIFFKLKLKCLLYLSTWRRVVILNQGFLRAKGHSSDLFYQKMLRHDLGNQNRWKTCKTPNITFYLQIKPFCTFVTSGFIHFCYKIKKKFNNSWKFNVARPSLENIYFSYHMMFAR